MPSPRWAEATATATEASPISRRPMRWCMAIVEHVPALADLALDLAHDLAGHSRVGVVFEVAHVSAEVVVAHDADEQRDRASFWREDQVVQRSWIEHIAGDLEEFVVGAAADGGNQRDLVAGA